MLLDCRFVEILPEHLDIGGDMQRLDIGELTELVVVTLSEKSAYGVQVSGARVPVMDSDSEKFQVAAGRLVAGVGDDRRHDHLSPNGRRDPRHLSGGGNGQQGGLGGDQVWYGFSVT